MDDMEVSDHVPVIQYPVRHPAGRTCPEIHGEAPGVIREAVCIEAVDTDLRVAHMGNFVDICDMVEMTVGEDDCPDTVPERLDCGRQHRCVDKDVSHQIRVSEKGTARDPSDWHAQ
jgi:hypothetical protein